MIGLVKKKKKKVKPGYKKKFNGRLMKSAAKPSALKIVLAVVQNVKQNAKHFNKKSWSTELCTDPKKVRQLILSKGFSSVLYRAKSF